MNIIEQFEKDQIKSLVKGKKIPQFHPGDTVRVNVKVREGTRERIQAFEGVCIRKKNRGLSSSFTVRKISFGEGVERVFPIFSPSIDSISIVRSGQVRRAKLYYLRDLTGKKARIVERIRKKQPDLASLYIDESEEVSVEEIVASDEPAQEEYVEGAADASLAEEKSESEVIDIRLKENEKEGTQEETIRTCLVIPRNFQDRSDLKHILMCTANGICKKIDMLDPTRVRRTGIRGISLDEGDSLISAALTDGDRELFFTSRNGMGLRVHESTIRSMGRDARGVIGMRLEPSDQVVSAFTHSGSGMILTVAENGYGKQSEINAFTLSKHSGNIGLRTMRINETTGPVVEMLEIEEEEQLLLITQTGRMIRIHTNQIPVIGRVTQGSRLIRLQEDERVIAISTVTEENEDAEESDVVPAENELLEEGTDASE